MNQPTIPHDIEAEEATLGSLLILGSDAFTTVNSILRPEDFYIATNRWIYNAYVNLVSSGINVDFLTISSELKRLNHRVEPDYLSALFEAVPTALHAEEYARQVQERAIRREAISVGTKLVRDGYDKQTDIDDILRAAESALLSIRRDGVRSNGSELFENLYDQIMAWAENPLNDGETRYLATGLKMLDRSLGGLEPGFYLVAARPSMGKTAVVLQIASNIALRGYRVLFFTLEMGEKQLGLRLACSEARVPLDSIKRGVASHKEHYRVTEAIDKMRKAPLSIHYGGSLRPGDVRAITQRALQHEDVALVVVDGMWLMASGRTNENRNLELGSISRELKLMADGLQIPVIAVHQLSRSCESRSDKRPMLSDLRESGRLEEDADVVLVLYREGYYDAKNPKANVMEIITRKNRLGGPAGDTALLYWQGEFMRCEAIAPRSLEMY